MRDQGRQRRKATRFRRTSWLRRGVVPPARSSDCQPFRSGHGRHVRSNFQKIHLESSFISMGINAWPPKTNLVALHCLCPQDESCSRGRIRTARALASNTFNSLSRRNHGWRHAFPFGLGRTGTGTPEKPRIPSPGPHVNCRQALTWNGPPCN